MDSLHGNIFAVLLFVHLELLALPSQKKKKTKIKFIHVKSHSKEVFTRKFIFFHYVQLKKKM